MTEQGDDDKQYDPTQKKLDDARKKGEVPRSADLTTAAAIGGFTLASVAFGGNSLSRIGVDFGTILSQAPALATDLFSGGAHAGTSEILATVALRTSPWFAIPFFAVIAMIIVQKSFVVAPTKIQPKLNRLSILANAKNKFGRNGLFEFAKSFTKLTVFSVILGYFLTGLAPKLISTTMLAPKQAAAMFMEITVSFIAIILLVTTAIGMVDFLWQTAEHTRKNRMSRKEMTDEAKQMEGDPYIKQKRRQKAQEIAANQMLADVPCADVIIVNPEHYAVALEWSRETGSAPACIAKGKNEIAARIRELAIEHSIPIHRDPPTARALFATIEIGQQIHPDHFRAVAAAIRFAEQMREKMSSRLKPR